MDADGSARRTLVQERHRASPPASPERPGRP
jgi:hypothetical protein